MACILSFRIVPCLHPWHALTIAYDDSVRQQLVCASLHAHPNNAYAHVLQVRHMAAMAAPPAAVIQQRAAAVARRVINIQKAFAACDKDGSGALDLMEFVQAMADIAGT